MVAGLDAFEEHHALAPTVPERRFGLTGREDQVMIAIAKKEMVLMMKLFVNTVTMTTNWCDLTSPRPKGRGFLLPASHVRDGECLTQHFGHDHVPHRIRCIPTLLFQGLRYLSAANRAVRRNSSRSGW